MNSYGVGDLLVNVNVWIPKKVSKEEAALLEKFSNSENFKANPTEEEKSFFKRIREYFN